MNQPFPALGCSDLGCTVDDLGYIDEAAGLGIPFLNMFTGGSSTTSESSAPGGNGGETGVWGSIGGMLTSLFGQTADIAKQYLASRAQNNQLAKIVKSLAAARQQQQKSLLASTAPPASQPAPSGPTIFSLNSDTSKLLLAAGAGAALIWLLKRR